MVNDVKKTVNTADVDYMRKTNYKFGTLLKQGTRMEIVFKKKWEMERARSFIHRKNKNYSLQNQLSFYLPLGVSEKENKGLGAQLEETN